MKQLPAHNGNVNFFTFFHFLKAESDTSMRTILLYALLSGIANAVLLGTINQVANGLEDGQMDVDYWMVGFFLSSLALYFVTKRYILMRSTSLVERTATKVRLRILDKIRKTQLSWLEEKGKPEIYTRITQDINWISNSAAIIINAAQGAFLAGFALIYIWYLSTTAFLLTLGMLVLGSVAWLRSEAAVHAELHQSNVMETRFFNVLSHILDGFKELKLNRRKNDDVYAHAEAVSSQHQELKLRTGVRYVMDFMYSQMMFYVLLGAVVFIVPAYTEDSFAEDATKLTAAVLFIMGPLENVISSIPAFNRANSAVGRVYALEAEVNAMVGNGAEEQPRDLFRDFERITLKGLEFTYMEDGRETYFTAGPYDLEIKKGELLFIIGGNGSGKSTLLKLLTGLYLPRSGEILLDGKRIGEANRSSYRELFGAIFTDFHLFDRLYGIPDLDSARVNDLLAQMKLGNKITYRDGEFSTLNLSTGQRKRIGIISVLLEDKPIFIFDEVAADQDPEFRQFFYEVLIRDFQAQGKTIIMVTHDDKYFGHADRVIKLDLGKVVSDTTVRT